MAKSKETFNKKEREKKRQKQKNDKQEKKQARRESDQNGRSFDDMIAYVDENGNFSSTPPDPSKRAVIDETKLYTGVAAREAVSTERTGRIDFFNEEKGFGFLIDAQSQERIFVHKSEMLEHLEENDMVSFTIERGARGLSAVQVKKNIHP